LQRTLGYQLTIRQPTWN